MADYASSTGGDKAGLFRRLRKQFRVDREFSAKWRKEAKEDFDFVAGEQWSAEDKEHLRSLMRPVITMNRTHTIINAVSGQEMSNRQETRYIPREEGDAKPNELLTEAARWFYDAASGDDENSEAFLHTTICGMGWVDTTLNFDEDEAGAPDMSAINPVEMFWDRNARKNNLTDAERVWRVKKLPLSKAREEFPDAEDGDLDAAWARVDGDDDGDPKDQDRERLYHDDGEGEDADDDDNVTIVHCQYVVKLPFYDVVTPLTQSKQEMPEKDYKVFARRAAELGLPLKAAKKMKRVIKDCWLGDVVLQTNDAICQDKFRYQCITGYRDETKGWFYGLVRGMKDPQRWANKWLSQTLDIMNSNAKGGLMAERGVTDDPRKLEKEWANASKVTWVEDGSLASPNGPRIQPKPQNQFPAGFHQLMEFAFQMIQTVPGVSPELLGQTDRDQPASLEYQRRQAGMTILQPLFKNLKRYRKEQGHVVLYILQHHLDDETMVRILGDEEAQYIKMGAIRQQAADVKYDIIVDDAPTSPNQKEMVWAMISDRFWDMPLQEQMVFIKFSPFPTSVVQELQKMAQDPSLQAQQQLQQGMQQAEVAEKTAKAKLAAAQAEQALANAHKLAMEAGTGDPAAQQEAVLAQQKFEQEMVQAQFEHQAKIAEHHAKMEEHKVKIATMQHDANLKAQSAQLEQARFGMDQQKAQTEQQTTQQKMQLDHQTSQQKLEIDRQKLQQQGDFKSKDLGLKVAAHNKTMVSEADKGAAAEGTPVTDVITTLGDAMEKQTKALVTGLEQQGKAIEHMAKVLAAPKKLIKDKAGKAVGVETVGA